MQRILSVKRDGLWGAIDMEGHAIIPFEHEAPLLISHDGTAAMGLNARHEQMIYAISYGDWPLVTAAPTAKPAPVPTPTEPEAEDSHWTCPDCGQLNDLNFCPSCGAARPEEPSACPSCGYVMPDGSVPNFCPNCGTAFR